MSRTCKDCDRFEYCSNGDYYCQYKESCHVNPDDDASSCSGFDPVSGYEEKEKRREEQDKDYIWRRSW